MNQCRIDTEKCERVNLHPSQVEDVKKICDSIRENMGKLVLDGLPGEISICPFIGAVDNPGLDANLFGFKS